MKRKVLPLLLCLLLLSSLVLPAGAASSLPMVIDSAGLLSDDERIALEEKAQALRTAYEMDVVILTVESLGGKTAQNCADDYYDDYGYGYGENYSGLLFLLAMQEREWYISTCGDAIYAITDYGTERIGEDVVWYLSAGNYYEAFDTYLDILPTYFDAYRQGAPIDGYAGNSDRYSHGTREDTVFYQPTKAVNYGSRFLVALVIGIIVAAVVIGIMCASMNTKRKQASASDYLKPGSYQLYRHQDMFLYSQMSKIRRQENKSGHNGGGSSVHTSSGGRSHGGGGGKF